MTDHGKVVRLLRIGPDKGKDVLERSDKKSCFLDKSVNDGRPHVRLEDRQARDQQSLRQVLLSQVQGDDPLPLRIAAKRQKPPQPQKPAPRLVPSAGTKDQEP